MAAAGEVTRSEVAKGAGLAGLARLGAVIEALAQPLFTWLFGLATYGLYVVLWGAVSLLSNFIDLAMTSALQRVVPAAKREEQAHAAVRLALMVAVLPALVIAGLVAWEAETVAALFSAAAEDRRSLPQAIRIFAWALPLWTFVEVATSAARARRAFGPEIRLRIFWEQIARILFALTFFAADAGSLGLVLAHLCSLALTAALCVPLLARYYDPKLLLKARLSQPLTRDVLLSGLALYPPSLARRLLIDAPPVVLNVLIPGAGGAVAAALFEIARKISTIPLIVRQAFQYVMAPLSSAQARADRAAIGPLYRFASRVSTALVVPLSGLLIFAGRDILSVYRPEAVAALPLLAILVMTRAAEAIVGPATSLVEMTGHRGLPLLNSLLGALSWALLTLLLVPDLGPVGMAISVAAGTLVIAVAATLELRLSDGLSPFDRKLVTGLAIALAGGAMMGTAEQFTNGPVRFASIFFLWAFTSWCALRFGLTRSDRDALGKVAHRLRLVPRQTRN